MLIKFKSVNKLTHVIALSCTQFDFPHPGSDPVYIHPLLNISRPCSKLQCCIIVYYVSHLVYAQ